MEAGIARPHACEMAKPLLPRETGTKETTRGRRACIGWPADPPWPAGGRSRFAAESYASIDHGCVARPAVPVRADPTAIKRASRQHNWVGFEASTSVQGADSYGTRLGSFSALFIHQLMSINAIYIHTSTSEANDRSSQHNNYIQGPLQRPKWICSH